MKPLLVGEANPYGGDPEFALYPDPPGCAGHRLCHKVMGLDAEEYLERFERVNLCPTKWSLREARERAIELAGPRAASTVVLLGARVARAFQYPFDPFAVHTSYWSGTVFNGIGRVVVLPHPSGLSRAWNAPGAYERAREALREAGVLGRVQEESR